MHFVNSTVPSHVSLEVKKQRFPCFPFVDRKMCQESSLMLPDIWSNASAREPEFSNCGLGKFVASEMKHKKMVNRDTEKTAANSLYWGIQYKKYLSVHNGFSEPFRKTPCAQILSDKDIIIMISVTFVSLWARKGKEGRRIYRAYIRTCERVSAQVSQRTNATDRLILYYFLWTAKCFNITCIWLQTKK